MNSIILALAPVLLIIVYVYFMDKYEKEPRHLLLFSFLLGAIVSILITTAFYLSYEFLLPPAQDSNIYHQLFKAFFVVALSEEFSKYIIVRYYAQPKREFNEPYDGIMYAVMVSMGFAATENIVYVLEGGYEVALVRAVSAIPAHATFGILMGYFMGRAKFKGNRIPNNLFGLLLAIIFHGAYDFFLFIDFIPGIWIGAFVSLSIAIVLSYYAMKIHQRNSLFKT